MTSIQTQILDYTHHRAANRVMNYSLRCLAGMMEGGESTEADFIACGGPSLLAEIKKWKKNNNKQIENRLQQPT